MEAEKVLQLVLQYLAESYPAALKVLEDEANVSYCEDNMKYGSELVTILNDYQDLMAAGGEEDKHKEFDNELLVSGSDNYASKLDIDLPPEAHQNASILSVAFSTDNKLVFATGATDKTVRIFDYQTKERVWEVTPHLAGVVSLAFNPVYHELLLTGSMDSTHTIFNVTDKVQLQLFKDHKKFVVRAKWHPNGKSFATASYDHSICIYNSEDPTKPDGFVLKKRLEFRGNVEAIDYSPDGLFLVASIRDDNYLHYIDTISYEITKNNMNANGDDHVSFTALDISISPSGKHILISTDKDRLILYRFNAETQVRNFYGASNDVLSQPRICWHPSGKYIYATSQDKAIYVWDVASQKIVHKLTGHAAIPRTMDLHPKTGYLLTGGFDKQLKSWIA